MILPQSWAEQNSTNEEYKVGIEDVLEIKVLQPEEISSIVSVSPDGTITFAYKSKTFRKQVITSRIFLFVLLKMAKIMSDH